MTLSKGAYMAERYDLMQVMEMPRTEALVVVDNRPHFEFVSQRARPIKTDRISPTRSPWDGYQKRKELIEHHKVDFVAIMNAMVADGYVKSAVAKYVNSIFL